MRVTKDYVFFWYGEFSNWLGIAITKARDRIVEEQNGIQ